MARRTALVLAGAAFLLLGFLLYRQYAASAGASLHLGDVAVTGKEIVDGKPVVHLLLAGREASLAIGGPDGERLCEAIIPGADYAGCVILADIPLREARRLGLLNELDQLDTDKLLADRAALERYGTLERLQAAESQNAKE